MTTDCSRREREHCRLFKKRKRTLHTVQEEKESTVDCSRKQENMDDCSKVRKIIVQ
jgi:hypothetical protein